ncbi:MAG: methylenetetrahydrofolate--tRNA-(uracil(54)-C(5))-methyltransferase (FADH(2)-oxidizing) TrmFO [Chloroflexi bacterium]|nr:methylenetetrahydrofolate--tRNA-(uracil(54)-C(5))-methyltransferase (FADH(2)-oxidizing) TrmFO [Chloroflexota bacterium]
MRDSRIIIVGGGLAGSESAWQLAQRGFQVDLYEMRPTKTTGAHVSDRLAELVCSNSMGSKLPDRASGLLNLELGLLRSHLLACAQAAALPAGGALAVDRELFAQSVTQSLEQHPNIRVLREEITRIPDTPTIIASGPLTSPALTQEITRLSGAEHLYFYDAISPIVSADSIDMNIAFKASRFGRGDDEEGDYINCPMTKDEYDAFVTALLQAETIQLRDFEREDPHFFEGCLPIEQIAARGHETLAFGPMRPIGLRDPRTGKRPYAVVQLRRDNLVGTLYNIVGFQTNLKWGQQQQIIRLIPGLQNAELLRMGQMHRNTFINAPTLLHPTMQFRQRAHLFFAGQITGVEGYMGNIATGLLAGINMARWLNGQPTYTLPPTTMLGALCHYVTHAEAQHFQPMKANFGILPPLPTPVKNKRDRYTAYVQRALNDMRGALTALGDDYLAANVEPSVASANPAPQL